MSGSTFDTESDIKPICTAKTMAARATNMLKDEFALNYQDISELKTQNTP